MVTLKVLRKWQLKLDNKWNAHTWDVIEWNVAWRCTFKNHQNHTKNHWQNFFLHRDSKGMDPMKRISPKMLNILTNTCHFWILIYWLTCSTKHRCFHKIAWNDLAVWYLQGKCTLVLPWELQIIFRIQLVYLPENARIQLLQMLPNTKLSTDSYVLTIEFMYYCYTLVFKKTICLTKFRRKNIF